MYDKNLESGGVTDCYRWEVEFSNERARDVLLKLAESRDVPEFGGVMAGLVAGAIDFRDPKKSSGDKNLSRRDRREWWQQIISLLGDRIYIRGKKPKPSVDRTVTAIEKQYSASLAMCYEAFGEDDFISWVRDMVSSGQSRLGHRHLSMIQAWMDNNVPEVEQFFEDVA